jgi:predicted nucleotidyltransferase
MKRIFPKNKTDSIIVYLLQNPNTKAKVNEIANNLKVNKATVSIVIKELEKEGIINRKQINLENPISKALKILIIAEKFINSNAMVLLKENSISAGIYGSTAKGTNTETSDIDIWMKPSRKFGKLEAATLSRKLTELLEKRVQLMLIDEQRLNSIKKESPNFYYSLVFGSVVLFGDGIN